MKKYLYLLIPAFLILGACNDTSRTSSSISSISTSSSVISSSATSSSTSTTSISSSSSISETYIDQINKLIKKEYSGYKLSIKNDYQVNSHNESLEDTYSLSTISSSGYKIEYDINSYSVIPSLSSSYSYSTFINNVHGVQELADGHYSLVSGEDYDLSNKKVDISKIEFKDSFFKNVASSSNQIKMDLANTDFIKSSIEYIAGKVEVNFADSILESLKIYLDLSTTSTCLISYTNFSITK